jgi:hypothetical protein
MGVYGGGAAAQIQKAAAEAGLRVEPTPVWPM